MRFSLVVAAILPPFLAHAANAACPCKDVIEIMKTTEQFNGVNLTCSGTCMTGFGIRAGSMYPVNDPGRGTYGSSVCKAHDFGLGKCNDTLACAPTWCYQSWCYVDKDNCDESDMTESRLWTTKNSAKLYYSYGACGGSAASWGAVLFERALL